MSRTLIVDVRNDFYENFTYIIIMVVFFIFIFLNTVQYSFEVLRINRHKTYSRAKSQEHPSQSAFLSRKPRPTPD